MPECDRHGYRTTVLDHTYRMIASSAPCQATVTGLFIVAVALRLILYGHSPSVRHALNFGLDT